MLPYSWRYDICAALGSWQSFFRIFERYIGDIQSPLIKFLQNCQEHSENIPAHAFLHAALSWSNSRTRFSTTLRHPTSTSAMILYRNFYRCMHTKIACRLCGQFMPLNDTGLEAHSSYVCYVCREATRSILQLNYDPPRYTSTSKQKDRAIMLQKIQQRQEHPRWLHAVQNMTRFRSIHLSGPSATSVMGYKALYQRLNMKARPHGNRQVTQIVIS